MESKFLRYVIYQLPWQLLMIAIFVQSSFSQVEFPDLGISWTDKLLHFSVFGILGWLVARGIYHSQHIERQQKYFKTTLIVCLIYAATDEIHQLWVPGRVADIFDFLADLIGIVFFAWLYKKWHNGRNEDMSESVREAVESKA